MLIQMPADLQFHFGNLRIGLPLRVPFAAWAVNRRQIRQPQWLGCGPLFRPLRFNLQIPEIRTAITAKENFPRRGRKFATRYGVGKFIGGLPSLLAELGPYPTAIVVFLA